MITNPSKANLEESLVRHRVLMAGDRAPDFILPDDTGTGRCLSNEIRGRPIILCFPDQGTDGTWLEEIRVSTSAYSPHFVAVLAAREDRGSWSRDKENQTEILLVDPAGQIRGYFLTNANVAPPAAFVLDPNQRILSIHQGTDAVQEANEALARYSQAPKKPMTVTSQAPVLIVPNVLRSDACEALIEIWRTSEQIDGKINYSSDEGEGLAINTNTKRRKDVVIDDRGLGTELRKVLGPRLANETYRAFHFDEFAMETFKIGCYSASDQGFFKAHRDNLGETMKRRRYAVTINFNSEEYEGGDLRFPEYGPDLYRPPTGGAIIFSCSLLHEVTPVSRGDRFTLLSFLLARSDAQAPA